MFSLQCLCCGEDIFIDFAMHFWADNHSVSMWKMIYNSSDIGFIHNKIYDWSCKKYMISISEKLLNIVRIYYGISLYNL